MPHVPYDGTNALLRWTIHAPLLFLDLAETTFTKVLNNLRRTSSPVKAAKIELRALVEELPTLRDAVLKHWPAEFTGRTGRE